MPKEKIKNKNCGFVLLFTLLISSILLSTGLGISRLMVRQISLASLSRESQVAFFAADSGVECAIRWKDMGKFDPSTDPNVPESRTVYCNGVIIKDGGPSVINGASGSSCDATAGSVANNIIMGEDKSCFTFSLSETANSGAAGAKAPCTFVVVDKTNASETKITSSGYNKCDLTKSNVLQRTVEVTLVD